MLKLPSSPLSIVPDLMISLGLSNKNQAASDKKDSHSSLVSPEKKITNPSLLIPAPRTETASTKSTGETDNFPMADSPTGPAALASNIDVRGSSSNSVEGNQKPPDSPASKISTESLLPHSSVANTDEVKSPGDEDAPDATESPKTRKTLRSSSSSSSSEEKADVALDASSNVRKEGTQPDSVESQRETSHQDISPTTEETLRPSSTPSSPKKAESLKPADASSPTTEEAPGKTTTPSSPKKAESLKPADASSPTTEEAPGKTTTPPSPTEAKSPKTADVFWPKTPESPGAARKLTPLKTSGFSKDIETQSPLKTTGTPRTADKPSSSEAHRPSISAEKWILPKTTRNPSTSSPQAVGNTTKSDRGSPLKIAESVKFADTPASPREAGSRKTSETRPLPKAAEVSDVADVSSSPKGVESSNIPSSLPTPESSKYSDVLSRRSFDQRADSENLYAAPEEEIESPHTSSSLHTSGPLKDRDVSSRRPSDQKADPQKSHAAPETEKNKEQPEPEIRSILVELPQAGAKGQELLIPKIFIERASDVMDEDDLRSGAKLPTADQRRKSGGMVQAAARVPSQGTSVLLYPSGSALRGPALPQIAENVEAPETPKILKRKLYLRKARNLAARNVLLKAALGRQLAGITKPVLRRLANGEPYGLDALEQVQVQVKVTNKPLDSVP